MAPKAQFPDEVLTRTKKGEVEVRSLIDRGRYVRYNYLHPESGEAMEGGPVTLSWQAQRHLNFTINYVAYIFGDFVTQSQPAQSDGNYVSAVATFRF